MGMVWCGGTALGTVVEDHQLGIVVEQLMDLAVGLADELRLVPDAGDGEVDGQDGEGIDEQVVLAVNALLHLFLGTVLLTEETGALGDGLGIDPGSSRAYAGGVPLHLYGGGSYGQLAGFDITQVVVAVAGIVPLLQLTVEEPLQGGVVHQFLFALEHLLTREDLQ